MVQKAEIHVGLDPKVIERIRGEELEHPKIDDKKAESHDDKKKRLVGWTLQNVAKKVLFTRDLRELGNLIQEASEANGDEKPITEVDSLRIGIAQKISELGGDRGEKTAEVVDQLVKTGKLIEAVNFVKELAKNEKLDSQQNSPVDKIIKKTEQVINETQPKKLGSEITKLEKQVVDMRESSSREIVSLRYELNELDQSVLRRSILETGDQDSKSQIKARGSVSMPEKDLKGAREGFIKLIDEKEELNDREKEADRIFINTLLRSDSRGHARVGDGGQARWEVDGLLRDRVIIMWGRINGLKGRYRDELNRNDHKQIRKVLDDLDFELRERLLQIQRDARAKEGVAEVVPPGERMWEELPPEERMLLTDNLNFMDKHDSPDKLFNYYANEMKKRGMEGEDDALKIFRQRYPEYSSRLTIVDGRLKWDGEVHEFYEVLRRELDEIKTSVPEEQLNQLVFVRAAALYMQLMGVSTKDNEGLQQAKEAVTNNLYMQFALKSLWKAGGNFEAVQRAAGLLLRNGADGNFFTTMKMREAIRLIDKDGRELKLGNRKIGFNVDDIMTTAELEAPNKTSWLAYISHDNMGVAKERLEEYGLAVTVQALKKAYLRKDISETELNKWLEDIKNGKFKIEKQQLEWMRDFTHYTMVASGRAGESLWLFNQVAPDKDGFNYASFPGGQYVVKSGPWAALYYAFYEVTKYNSEWVGKVLLPINGLLSFARGETMSHFITKKTGDVWMKTPDGGILKTKMGAQEFFFKNVTDGTLKGNISDDFNIFMRDMLLDERTGKEWKARGMRAFEKARAKGAQMIAENKHIAFAKYMDFEALETRLGHKIPGVKAEEKFVWMVNNMGYEMMDMESMPSKREGDLVNKYWKYINELVTKLKEGMDNPSLANKMAMLDLIGQYNNGAVADFAEFYDKMLKNIRSPGIRLKEGGKWYNPFDYEIGPRRAKKKDKSYIYDKSMGQDGEYFTLEEETESPATGWYPGRGFLWTTQELKQGFRDPHIVRRIEIDNMIRWGIVTPQEGGKMMREWQADMYFGPGIEVGGVKLRPGYIPLLTPFYLYRGWFVDRMRLTWEDFMMITRKNNEEVWEKLKKVVNFSA